MERCLGAFHKAVAPSRRRLGDDLKIVECGLVCNQLRPEEETEVIGKARAIYCRFYGPPRRRKPGARRWTSGRQAGAERVGAATTWQAKRRATLTKGMAPLSRRDTSMVLADAAKWAGASWSTKHEQESQKLARWAQMRRDDTELNDLKRRRLNGEPVQIPLRLQKRDQTRREADRERAAQEAAGRRMGERPEPVDWRRHHTLVEVGSAAERDNIVRRLVQAGGRVTNNLAAATAFITQDPSSATVGMTWRAVLGGCPIASAKFDDPTAAVLHHRPAPEVVPADLWVSQQFQDRLLFVVFQASGT